MTEETRTYYKIRRPYKIRRLDCVGTIDEWHASNNQTDQWGSLKQIKAVLTRGIRSGYKGSIKTPFENYEVHKFTEEVKVSSEVVDL